MISVYVVFPLVVFFFFFQAEDGIRDGHVTGVQTCALPISPVHRFRTAFEKAAGGTRALRSFPLTFWRDACTISASSPKSLIAVVRAAGDRRRGTHHGHRDDYSSSLPQLH